MEASWLKAREGEDGRVVWECARMFWRQLVLGCAHGLTDLVAVFLYVCPQTGGGECMAAEPKGIGKRAIDPDYESHILRSDVKRLCAELKESRAELKEARAELIDGHMVRYDLKEAQKDLVRVRGQLSIAALLYE
jgi:hypothetical protein